MHSHHNHYRQNLSMDQCAYRSRLRSWNSEWKLFFVLLVIVLNLVLDRVSVAVYTFIFMGFLSVRGGKLLFSYYLHALGIPLTFIFLGSIAIGVEFGAVPRGIISFSLGFTYVYVTRLSLARMLLVITKALAAVSAMYLVTLSTPAGEFIAALKKLHLPTLFIELMHLIYRYIFILLEAQQNMRQAAEARLGSVDFKASCKSFSAIMGNLLVVSLKKSRTYFDAMESRCYDTGGFFYQEKKAVAGTQVGCMMVYFILLVGICLLVPTAGMAFWI